MKTFFTSDNHFNQQHTLDIYNRPFASLEESNEEMVTRWNNKVGEGDVVYILGDFGDISFTERLNGSKVLVEGNHERDGKYTTEDLEEAFDLVIPALSTEMYFSNPVHGGTSLVRMVHEPSHSDFKTFTLFGHIHNFQMIKRNGLNVGVDCHNFTPISLETMLDYKFKIENFYDEEIFM